MTSKGGQQRLSATPVVGLGTPDQAGARWKVLLPQPVQRRDKPIPSTDQVVDVSEAPGNPS
jgi:hypothetical protein